MSFDGAVTTNPARTSGIGGEVVDVGALLDDAPIGRLMVRVGMLCAIVAMLDGTDTTSIGVAAPLISEKLGLSAAYLGPIFSAAVFGAMVGAATFGSLADRVGRKTMLLLATAVFGVFTIATAFAGSFESLLAVRFLLGIGLGGAAPCFIALAAEYAPRSQRELITGLIWTAFPLGVILGAMANAFLLAHVNWQAIFLVGGVLPLISCVLTAIWLPESLRFLVAKRPASPEIGRIVRLISLASPPPARITAAAPPLAPLRPVEPTRTGLFSGGRAIETLLLWVSFLAAFGMTAVTFFWSPSLLHAHGISLPVASLIVGVGGGVGSLIGAASAGRLMETFGSTATLGATFLLATITTGTLGYAARSTLPMVVDVLANGVLFAGIGTAGMLALAAGLYPTPMRSTGVGWAMGAGRLGEVVMPLLVGALMVRTGKLGETVFLLLAVVPLAGFVAVLALKREAARLEAADRQA